MKMRRVSTLSLFAVGTLLAAASCAGGGGSSTGAAGKGGSAGATGAAGMNGSGAAGMDGTTGAAGMDTSGAAGTNDTGAAGSATAGAAGSTTGIGGTTGTAGEGSAGATGTAGAGTAGAMGTAGSGALPAGVQSGMSEGCGKPAMDTPGKYVMHNIMVTLTTSKTGDWTHRVYYLDLPTGYDPTKPYPIMFGGAGCGGAPQTNGSSGGFAVLPANNTQAIQVGMSYTNGSCFAQGGADNPEAPYFDAMLKEIESNYCVDKGRVFVGGYSSGGWMGYMLAFARGGVVRGISVAAGGIATMANRPPDTMLPVAGLLLTGAIDTTNPASGPTGSDVAMNLMLQYNKCNGTDTVPWEIPCPSCACVRYTGCPDQYPVVRCHPPGQGHTDGGGDFKTAIWKEWMMLHTP